MEFVCHVGTAEGRVMRQVRRAPNEEALRAELERDGLQLVGLERKAGALPRAPRFGFGRRKVPLQLLLIFSQELAALLRAGLPLLQALQMLVTRQRDPLFKSYLDQVLEKVRSGAELSEAFGSFDDAFPTLYSSSLRAGERTGELEQVLTRFCRYLKLVLDAQRRVYSALVYPTLLVILSFGMLGIMAVFVVPRFQVFYDAMELSELPILTRITLATGHFLRTNLIWLVAGGLFAWATLDRWSRTSPGRLALSRFRLKLPVLGGIFHRFAISEYCRSLSTLVAGGLPLVQALEISTQGVGNTWIRGKLEPVVPRVREGYALHSALEEVGIVPELAVDMVEVGEATGGLDVMLGNISTFLDEEVETRMARLLTLIEPLLLLVVGGLVAVLLISVYLPIFSALSRIQ